MLDQLEVQSINNVNLCKRIDSLFVQYGEVRNESVELKAEHDVLKQLLQTKTKCAWII